MKRTVAVLFVVSLLLAGLPRPAMAGWPSAVDVIKKVGPLAGLTSDQIEFTVFAMKEPDCAATIVAYTAAQDYSLVAFIAALKTTKFKSLPQLPKMSEAQCKAYNPVQQAYLFVDGIGNRFLGASKADYLRGLLSEQIAEGKSALEGELASIPVAGSILAHWDCECSAAFKTDFKDEKMIDQKVGDVIAIGRFVRNGDIPGALERMVTSLGPEVACDLGAAWTGVGSIPVVSDIAAEACSSIAGEAVGWVVSGAGSTAEALGIIGGEHIPPDEYYKNIFTPEVAKDGYMELADILYGKCYKYFEASNMAASTAKKVCVGMRARYVEESLGKIQWTAFQAERQGYYKANVEPKGVGGARSDDAAFASVKKEVDTACRSYFSQKYPKATAYAKAYGGEPIEDICTSFVTYNASQYHPWDIDKARKNAQLALQSAVIASNKPFCQAGPARNEIICSDQGIKACFAELPDICAKSQMALGGMERPCCKLGQGVDSVTESKGAAAESMAKKAGGPYCRTEKADPFRIVCGLQQTYDACRKSKTWQGGLPDCSTAASLPNGASADICCVLDAALLAKIPGAASARKFVDEQNKVSDGACAVGGFHKGLSYDPMIVNCRSDVVPVCEKAFDGSCSAGDGGFVKAPCCEHSVFSSAPAVEAPYDPASRDPAELALTKKAVDQSKGSCSFAPGPEGVPDLFKVSCRTEAAGKMCLEVLGRPAKTPCAKKMSKNGWVTSPCCLRDMSALTDQPVRELGKDAGMKGIKAGDIDIKASGALNVLGGKSGESRGVGRGASPRTSAGGRTEGGIAPRATPERASERGFAPEREPDGLRATPDAGREPPSERDRRRLEDEDGREEESSRGR